MTSGDEDKTKEPAPAAPGAPTTEWHVVPLGGLKRGGVWRPRHRTVLVTLIGGMDLDLTEAEPLSGEMTLIKVSIVGGVRLRVPPGTRVRVGGVTLFGGRRVELTGGSGQETEIVRLRAFGLVGGIHVSS